MIWISEIYDLVMNLEIYDDLVMNKGNAWWSELIMNKEMYDELFWIWDMHDDIIRNDWMYDELIMH